MADVSPDVRTRLLREHGDFPQAYSAACQPGLSHFGDEHGFIAHKMVWGTAMVLADPVAPADGRAALIDRFIAQHPDVVFCQVSRPTAALLAQRGFFVNEMGPDPRLDLASYSFSGKDKQNLRTAMNRAVSRGYAVRECPVAELDMNAVRTLSDQWRSTRSIQSREVSFLNRPMVFEDEPDVRKMFLFDKDGVLMAFGGFDPIYQAGSVVGYIAQHSRTHPAADSLANNAIKHHAITTFQQEGKRWFYLGLAPFADINDRDFPERKNWLTRRAFRFAYTNPLFNRWVYPLQGHDAHKRQFRGEAEQTYLAFNKTPAIIRLLKLLRACNIV